MQSLRDIIKRIRAVENTRQITKAMEMVAAARLRKAQQQIESFRPYAQKMREMLTHLSQASGTVEHPYFERRDVNKSAVVLVTSDRGLCGSFNSNLIRYTNSYLAEHQDENPALVLVGKKGNDFFKRRDHEIMKTYLDFAGKMDFMRVREITRDLTRMFVEKEVDKITFIYTTFVSMGRFRITDMQFLPIVADFGDEEEEEHGGGKDYIFEPDASEIYKRLLPSYARVVVQMVLADSFASEHGTRMIAMGSATKNAGELIEFLTLQRNKARQATITNELLDIVGGAEALNQ
ncbi:MAG: ATP synthase F1 subunit gamma [candidate division Zixibacteria bacterium]|nr:ATP synthase F1 subunit gamma [candidate division Zixibacteria bacterium]